MKKLFHIILATSILFAWGSQAHAARYYFSSEKTEFSSEGFFQIDLYLDSESEVINAFEGELQLPGSLVSIVDIRTGGSFVSFWVKPPKQTSTSSVDFAGIFPGGFNANNAYLFSVIAQVKDFATRQTASSPFSGQVTMQNMSVLLHDGLGSPADVSVSPFSFSISRTVATVNEAREVLQANDEDPPEAFQPVVTTDKNLYEGKYSLVFATQDKGVGVSHYEVHEADKPIVDADPSIAIEEWERVESPYLLQDQSLSKYVYVKAVDKVGNERVVLVPAEHPMGGYSTRALWGIIITIVIVFVVLGLVLWHHQVPMQKKEDKQRRSSRKN